MKTNSQTQPDDSPQLTLDQAPGPPIAPTDAQYLSSLSEKYLIELNQKSTLVPKLTPARRLGRSVHMVRQWFARKGRELIQEHWDIGLFNVIFGALKAFLIYPALYFAELIWTIPIMEYFFLNTEFWTAGYLFCRKHILSKIGQLRYGHSLIEMNQFRDETIKIQPRDARNIHRFGYGSFERTVRIRRSRFVDWMRSLRGLGREPNVVLQSELRKMISQEEFLFQANELRNNAYLYEEIAIRKILTTPEDRQKLLERLVPETPSADQRDRQLSDAIDETLIPTYARVIEQGNSLTDTLKINLGHKFSATSLALRWINWSYQRTIYRKLAELEVLQYRLLADILDGKSLDESEHLIGIRGKREEIRTWIELAASFGEQAKAVSSKPEAHQQIQIGIREARAVGLRVRLARMAFWLSPSARHGNLQ